MGGDLRQVGHAQDLVAAGERPQAPPDRIGAAAADPRVDLVEDERRRVVGLGQDLLDRERDPAHLAAGRDPGERPRRLAGVRGEQEDDLVDAGRVERDRVAVELDRGLVLVGRPAPERDLEDARREPELDQDRADLVRQRAAGGVLRVRDSAAAASATDDEEPRLLRPPDVPLRLEAPQPLRLRPRPARRGR